MPFAKINSHILHYTDVPPENKQQPKQTIIFVHGLGSTQNYFFPILPHLTEYRSVIYDNYNAGRSQSDGGDVSVDGMGEDVLGLMERLGIGKAVVVG